MSQAIAPPTVTWRVPGSTGTHSPNGQRRLHQLVQADAGVDVDQPGVGADRVDAVQRRHVDHQAAAVLGVVAVGAAQPACDHAPSVRAAASATRATALAITSGSGVESTWATDGAVRPKPVSRVVVVGTSLLNIVKEGTACDAVGSANAEDHRSLHDEVDHRRGALRDHERDGYRPRRGSAKAQGTGG